MIKFDILGEYEKKSFTNVLDWQQNYKSIKCANHDKNAILNLLIEKSGSSVSVAACCEDFFLEIVEKKNNTHFGSTAVKGGRLKQSRLELSQ